MAKVKAGDLFLASHVDVVRGKNADGSPKVERIAANQMVTDTDLKPAEIEQLKREGVLRVPTQSEREAIDAAADAADAAEAAAKKAADDELAAQKAAAKGTK